MEWAFVFLDDMRNILYEVVLGFAYGFSCVHAANEDYEDILLKIELFWLGQESESVDQQFLNLLQDFVIDFLNVDNLFDDVPAVNLTFSKVFLLFSTADWTDLVNQLRHTLHHYEWVLVQFFKIFNVVEEGWQDIATRLRTVD